MPSPHLTHPHSGRMSRLGDRKASPLRRWDSWTPEIPNIPTRRRHRHATMQVRQNRQEASPTADARQRKSAPIQNAKCPRQAQPHSQTERSSPRSHDPHRRSAQRHPEPRQDFRKTQCSPHRKNRPQEGRSGSNAHDDARCSHEASLTGTSSSSRNQENDADRPPPSAVRPCEFQAEGGRPRTRKKARTRDQLHRSEHSNCQPHGLPRYAPSPRGEAPPKRKIDRPPSAPLP